MPIPSGLYSFKTAKGGWIPAHRVISALHRRALSLAGANIVIWTLFPFYEFHPT